MRRVLVGMVGGLLALAGLAVRRRLEAGFGDRLEGRVGSFCE